MYMATITADTHFNNYFATRLPPTIDIRFKFYHLYDYVNNVSTIQSSSGLQPGPISYIPSEGIILTIPGVYYFTNDIVWKPTNPAAAITIRSNDVTIDLRSFMLKCCNSNGIAGIYADNVSNLSIVNGCITGFNIYGIFCTGIVNTNISNIKVTHLRNQNCSKTAIGILCILSFNVIMYKCTVASISVKGPGFTGIQLLVVAGCAVTECAVKNVHNETGGCAGISHIFCTEIEIKRCRLSYISSSPIENTLAIGHTTIGILPTYCDNLLIEDCIITHITGSCDDAHGISVFVCTNTSVQNCSVKYVTTGDERGKSAKSTGVEIYCDKCVVTNCSAEYITASNPGDRQCTGFSNAASDGVMFINCIAKNVYILVGKGVGIGFGWAPDMRPQFSKPALYTRVVNCRAIDCQIGFDTWNHVNGSWENIITKRCCTDVLNKVGGCRIITCNQCSECPGTGKYGKTVVIKNVAHRNIIQNLTVKCKHDTDCKRGTYSVLRLLKHQ